MYRPFGKTLTYQSTEPGILALHLCTAHKHPCICIASNKLKKTPKSER